MKKRWRPPGHGNTLQRFLCTTIVLLSALLLSGCSEMILFHPRGPIGETERFVITVAFALMLIVVIPVIFMTGWFAWRYRASNTRASYAPKWSFSAAIELVVWIIPAIIVTSLGILIWHTTYDVDPYKPLESDVEPLTIEAISLDWKWLFIYPDHDIGVVNELVFPVDVPLNFKITSDTVMTSFFIPQLGSQIYGMAGMTTRLHLLAEETGTFLGQNQQFSGEGYSEMKFDAKAVSEEKFTAWVQQLQDAEKPLDLDTFEALRQPQEGYYPVTYYSSVSPGLFSHVIEKYVPPHHTIEPQSGHAEAGEKRE